MNTYFLCGVNLATDVPLANALPAAGAAEVTLVAADPRPVPSTQPDGVVLNAVTGTDGTLIGATSRASDETITIRVSGIVDFVLDPVTGRADYARDPNASESLIPVFAAGLFVASYLQVTGRSVLHASASHVPSLDGAVGFVGASGTGKSTVATMMAAGAYPLVADDLLRIEPDGAGYRCFRGAVETRLRPKAAPLAEQFTDVHRTGDDRLSIPLPICDAERLPLRALVVPGPDPDAGEVELTRITGAQALFTLMAFPRLLNWQDPANPSAALDLHADLVQGVPVFLSRLPWGPPFDPDFAEQLVTRLADQLD